MSILGFSSVRYGDFSGTMYSWAPHILSRNKFPSKPTSLSDYEERSIISEPRLVVLRTGNTLQRLARVLKQGQVIEFYRSLLEIMGLANIGGSAG